MLEEDPGTVQGLGYIARLARSLIAGGFLDDLINEANRYLGDRVVLPRFGARDMPCDDHSFDVVSLFNAIYYLSRAERLVDERERVLRSAGEVLIFGVNKDLYDCGSGRHAHASFRSHGRIPQKGL